MCEGSHGCLESRRENLVEFFGEEEVVGVDEASERFPGLVLSQEKRAIVVRNVLALVLPTGNEGWVEDGSGSRIRGEFSVHLGVLGELGLKECGSARSSALWYVGVDRVAVPRCCRCGVVGDGVEVDNGVSGDHVRQLRRDIFWGSSFEVLGFMVHLEIMCGSLD